MGMDFGIFYEIELRKPYGPRAEYDVSGRVLVRRFHVGNVVEFSDYQKFAVGSEETFKVRK